MKEFIETGLVLVDVQDVKKSYGTHVVLQGVNLMIKDIRILDGGVTKASQIASILGPSGVGKTTLFNAMAGLVIPDSGRVLIDNPAILPVEETTIQDLIPTDRSLVGVVYQNYALFEFMTVRELCNLVFNESSLVGRKKPNYKDQKELVNQYLDHFGLTEHADKFPKQLSGGQRQRVAIVQQMLRQPQLLLMDEPFSGLDPETKGKLIERISSISKLNEYLSIIMISHDIGAALTISDTVYFMGVNRDELGKPTYGASIQHHLTMDLKKMGLAWHDNDREKLNEIAKLQVEASSYFPKLSGKA